VIQEKEVEEVREAPLLVVDHALKFMLAGNSTFTLRSVKTGVRFTYKAKRVCCKDCKLDVATYSRATKCKSCPCHAPGKPANYFVKLLVGPQNTSDYQYMGMLALNQETQKLAFITTRASRIGNEAPSVKALQFVLTCLQNGQFPPAVEIWHAGKCGMCGRKLTVPESINIGIGPECLSRM